MCFCFLALLHRLQLTEVSRQQIEQELSISNKDKAEIIEQFQQVKKNQLFKNSFSVFVFL
jgi:hypothetical protein